MTSIGVADSAGAVHSSKDSNNARLDEAIMMFPQTFMAVNGDTGTAGGAMSKIVSSHARFPALSNTPWVRQQRGTVSA
ncbi:hypothetical protein [Xanthomonas melonis]|uniref:hypothetical protein n=1 Tax=Xanthomonas melonis TaxID=56456 RepID=UPI001ABFB5C2|nr:hypothetical protein [Xanthomonas melonis]